MEEKKKRAISEFDANTHRDQSDCLEAFYQRLRELCADNLGSFGSDGPTLSENQAQHACALAGEFGIHKRVGLTRDQFREDNPLYVGTEHAVELFAELGRVVKITVPPKFGLSPRVVSHPVINLRGDPALPSDRLSTELGSATPLEYLQSWRAANLVFGDQVTLTSVVEWADGLISFVITQPQYHGEPASARDIERYFEASGWTRVLDDSGHLLFYNYGFQVLAIDALPRNCYLHGDELLPFDVILCHPDAHLEKLLRLYPE